MDDDADVANVNQPIGLVESKAGQYVPRCLVPKGPVTKATAKEIEHGGCRHPNKACLLHYLVLCWRRFQGVLTESYVLRLIVNRIY